MAEKKAKYIFLNGKVVPYSEAKIHVMSPAVRYGSNVFEGIRGYWNEEKKQLYLFKLRQHLQRLQNSIKLMRFEGTYEIEELEKWILDLVRQNEIKEDMHIRPQVFLDGEGGGVGTRGPVGIAIIAIPMARYMKEEGVTAMVSSWRRIDDDVMPPRIKCAANYQNNRLALIEANMHGYDASIILNRDGKVTEEARACIFICRDGVPITPPVTCGILESITRRTLLQLFSEELGIKALEREIDRTELYVADEAFFCGSGAETTPIISIDGYPFPIGPITTSIKKVYFDIARGKTDKYSEWRTPVY
jgi:branched-chain amino acid aminotransferase